MDYVADADSESWDEEPGDTEYDEGFGYEEDDEDEYE
jgi:hypothetical protein